MLHIATVHWMNDKWIQVQRDYFEKFAGGNCKFYGFVNGIDKDYSHMFDFYSTEMISCCNAAGQNHGTKLNILADVIASQAKDDEIIVFIDGDAFPIENLFSYVNKHLQQFPLLAVRREEHLADKQPHPSFAATTVGVWKELKGDWRPGYEWEDSEGHSVTDTGGNLLGRLVDTGIDWMPVLRSNKKNMHPLWFGVYGGVVYHHGAGFRGKIERLDRLAIDRQFPFRTLIKNWQNSDHSIRKNIGYLLNRIYNHSSFDEEVIKVKQKNKILMDNIFAQITTDPYFWKQFMQQEDIIV